MTLNRIGIRTSAVGYRPVLVGLLALVFMCGVAIGNAKADFYIFYSEDAGPVSPPIFSIPAVEDPIFLPGTVSFVAASGPIAPDFTTDITSKDLGSTGLVGQVNTTQIDVVNLGAGTHTLHVFVVNNDFTFPVGSPLLLKSDLAASANPADGTLALTSGIDTPAAGPFPAPAFPPTDAVPTVSLVGAPGETVLSKVVARVAGGFSLLQEIDATLSGNETASLTATTTIQNVPEPRMVAALVGMAGMMGLGLFFQRRRSRV